MRFRRVNDIARSKVYAAGLAFADDDQHARNSHCYPDDEFYRGPAIRSVPR